MKRDLEVVTADGKIRVFENAFCVWREGVGGMVREEVGNIFQFFKIPKRNRYTSCWKLQQEDNFHGGKKLDVLVSFWITVLFL
jgi:hypothetical protein